MAIGDDFSIAVNGDIRHISGSTTYTVLELHRWLQDLADQAQGSGNDLLDITTLTPSTRATDNIITLNSPFNIDDGTAEYFYDGSIQQKGGDELYSGLVVVGAVYGTTTLQVVQLNALYDGDTPFWGTGINADPANNILCRMLIKTRMGGVDRDSKKIRVYAREWGATFAEFEVTMGLGNSVAAIFTTQDLNNQTVVGTVATWTTITNVEGYQTIDLDNGNGPKPYYSKWNRDIYTINQLYERTKYIGRRGTAETIHTMDGELFRGITHQWAYDNESGGPFTEDEWMAWGCTFAYDNESGGPFIVGEKLTFGTSGAIGILLLLDDAGAAGNMVVQIVSGTPADDNTITGATSSATAQVNGTVSNPTAAGGTARLLALLDSGATGTMWVQLLTGSPPVNNLPIRGDSSNATCDVNGSYTARTVSPVFLGVSTGTAIIGAFGIGIEAADLSQYDKLFDLNGDQQTPPNNVQFIVYGLVSGEDRVIVTWDDGSNIDFDQMLLATALTGATETQVDVGVGNIPADTPQTGTLRIELDTGIYRLVSYTAHDNSRYFTIPSTNFTDPNDAAIGNNVFISYIDKLATSTQESVTIKYSVARTMFVRVRDGGATPIKTFEGTASLGTGGGSITAIRTSDT